MSEVKPTDAEGNELPQPEIASKPVVAKYRSKPCVIEAIHYEGTKASFDAIYEWMDGDNPKSANLGYRGPSDNDPQQFGIKTLEGQVIASPGDWIIKGTHGEFYPRKPEVFAVKYELADALPQPIGGEGAKVERFYAERIEIDEDGRAHHVGGDKCVTAEDHDELVAKLQREAQYWYDEFTRIAHQFRVAVDPSDSRKLTPEGTAKLASEYRIRAAQQADGAMKQ